MKFRAAVKDFSEGLSSAISVATKGVVKEHPLAFLVTLAAEKDEIVALSHGGRMSIRSFISDRHGCDDLRYDCEDTGFCTVRASDLKATLSSFDESDEIWIELRTYDEPQDSDDGDDGDDEAPNAEKDSGRELVLTLVNDPEQFQTMPTYRETIEIPQMVNDIMETKGDDDALQVRRDVFINGANRVFFARGFEDEREAYKYWTINAQPGEVRFAAGSGPRFAVLDLSGHDLTKGKDKFSLLMPNDQTSAILDILNQSIDEYINFYPEDKYLIMKGNSFLAYVAQYDADVKWPDVNMFLDRKSPIKLTTQIKNWANVVRGISATYNDEMKKAHDIHFATLNIDFDNSDFIETKTEGVMRARRKVGVDDIEIEDSAKKEGALTVSCVSFYLAEAVKRAADDDHVQVEFESSKSPIVFRYHAGAKVDERDFWSEPDPSGIKERYSIFFAPKKSRR